MVLVGEVQVPEPAVLVAPVTVVAAVGSVRLAPLVKVVDVAWMFQPNALPVRSLGVRATLAVPVRFAPVSVTPENDVLAGGVIVRLPLPQVSGLNVATTAAHAPRVELLIDSLTVPAARPVR